MPKRALIVIDSQIEIVVGEIESIDLTILEIQGLPAADVADAPAVTVLREIQKTWRDLLTRLQTARDAIRIIKR